MKRSSGFSKKDFCTPSEKEGRAYGRDLARYQAHLTRRGVDPLTATDEDVLAFVHVLQGEGLAPSSVTRTLVAVRGLHRFHDAGNGSLADRALNGQPRHRHAARKAVAKSLKHGLHD